MWRPSLSAPAWIWAVRSSPSGGTSPVRFIVFASESDFVVKRVIVEDYLSLAIVAAMATLVISLRVFEPVQDVARDGLLRIAATWPPAIPTELPDTAVVAIDSQSLRAYPDWPWPRSRHAELVQRLSAAGAEAIASMSISRWFVIQKTMRASVRQSPPPAGSCWAPCASTRSSM